jgi:hypothetical protein
MVTKSAFADNFWERRLADSPDPAMREMYWRARWGQDGGS